MVTAVVLLAAGCGDDGSGDSGPEATPSSTGSTASPSPGDETGVVTSTATSETPEVPEDATTALTDEGTPDPTRVEQVAAILECELSDGKQAVDGETEYRCGEFLIVDWGTAGVTEEEMWAHVDAWVDEQRPTYVPADQFILVYGTDEALAPYSEELLEG